MHILLNTGVFGWVYFGALSNCTIAISFYPLQSKLISCKEDITIFDAWDLKNRTESVVLSETAVRGFHPIIEKFNYCVPFCS